MIDPVEFGKAMGAIVRDAVAPLLTRIDALEARYPERGEKGDPGRDGNDAEPVLVADVVDELVKTDALAPLIDLMVAEAVAKHFEANPVQHGRDGEQGPQGEKGEPGPAGADGIGVAGALIDRDGSLVVTLANGEQKNLGLVVGRDGEPGKDGKDGLSMASVERTYDADAHEVVERWEVGGEQKELRYPAGGLRPGGFWRDGMKCHALQAITHDGALWIAKRDTAAKPCLENSEDWQLAARKGRDGRDGKDGKLPPEHVSLRRLGDSDGA